eukprot:228968_1
MLHLNNEKQCKQIKMLTSSVLVFSSFVSKSYNTIVASRRKKVKYRFKKILRLQTKLKINGLLQKCSEVHLNKCLSEIINLFGGIESLLVFIVKNCEMNKLDSIYHIARKIKIESHNSSNINTILNYFKPESYEMNENIPIEKKQNVFNLIPNESITNICSFLTKNVIKKK